MIALALIATVIFSLTLTACAGKDSNEDLWSSAIYTSDTELGEGERTAVVQVSAGDKSVIFTVHTDRTILGEALEENGLISGEQGQYGLYVKTVDGISADFDKDGVYWAFYIDGEYALSGVDTTEISEEAEYTLACEK